MAKKPPFPPKSLAKREAADEAMDKRRGIKEMSPADRKLDKRAGLPPFIKGKRT